MGSLTQEEKLLTQVFRDKVKVYLPPDDEYYLSEEFLIRWIRARDKNLEAAETMLKISMKWRKDNKISQVLSLPISDVIRMTFHYEIIEKDKLGRPMLIIPLGKWDLGKVTKDAALFASLKIHITQILEKLMIGIRKNNAARAKDAAPISQFSVLYGFNGFAFQPLMNATVDQRLVEISHLFENNYPESLGTCLFINCPASISILLNIIQLAMSAKNFSKIQHFGTDRAQWQRAVTDLVDTDLITTEYGGTKM